MDYATYQGRKKHPIGLIIVLLMHAVLAWALVNGLARKVVEVIKAPIETKLIEEVKPPPPPPPENLPPPPPKNIAPPPPAFVPPPEINVPPPPTTAPSITVTREVPPPQPPVTIAPAAPPAPPAPPAPAAAPPAPPAPPPKPRIGNATVDASRCVNTDEYPPAAARAEATGTTRVRLHVDPNGVVSKADVIQSAGPSREHKMLDRSAVQQLTSGNCRGQAPTDDAGNPIPGTVDKDIVWKLN